MDTNEKIGNPKSRRNIDEPTLMDDIKGLPKHKKRVCTCVDWQNNIAFVNDPISLQAIRSGTVGYEGEPFHFCPWCARKLLEITTSK